ncbi:MAG: hypothetical protein HKM93_15985 [Desulfobacteraceae bacterium]|nr:hypothetical protein [Desulfobacteraceae bacterium]
MAGKIHSDQRCPVCGGRFKHDENRRGLICTGQGSHPETRATGRFRVYFKSTTSRFGNDFMAAERFLNYLRAKEDNNEYDPRDYRADVPLGFSTLADRWLSFKKRDIKSSRRKKALSDSHLRNLSNYMTRAKAHWNHKNIKHITEGDIDDFLFSISEISEKTRANHKSCLQDFWKWVCRREKDLRMPIFPEVEFELEYRKITTWETQSAIIDKVYEQTYHLNPKIWLGIDMLATYTNIRPKDLLQIKEEHIDMENGIIVFLYPTKTRNKTKSIRLLDEHIEEIRILKKRYPALPHMYFFRHVGGIQSVTRDEPFGEKYFYKWWIRACDALGIEGIDLYGGTRHTTTTEIAMQMGKEKAIQGLGNTSNKSIERYCQVQDNDTFEIVQLSTELKKKRSKKGKAKVVKLNRK